jgi:hypothetical protein
MSCLPKWDKSSNYTYNNPKKLIATTRFGEGTTKSLCYLRGLGFVGEGDEGVEANGGANKPLPQLDGGIQQFKDGTCLYEDINSDLSKEEKKKSNQQWELYKEQAGEIIWEAFES